MSSHLLPRSFQRKKKEEIVLDYDYEKNTLRDNYMSFVLRNQTEEKFRGIFDRVYDWECTSLPS